MSINGDSRIRFGRRVLALRRLVGFLGRATSIAITVACSVLVVLCAAPVRAAQPLEAAAALQELKNFRQLGTVLFIAAHPDDENTQLITYLARGRGYRTTYLSVTRGDGGQNLIGAEFGPLLGVIRTQELLAARRIDGGEQLFTRAIDFGFSKSDRETLEIWDHEAVLGDVVRAIRTLRPDIVITRFSPRPSGTHGHHTASAVLGVEAFKLAGDATAYPEQLDKLEPWQPKRILENGGGRWRGGGDDEGAAIQIDVDGSDPVLGVTFGELAGQSRAMHKSQGFGNFANFGGGRGGGGRGGGQGGGNRRMESFTLLAGESATTDIMDGVDVTWRRFDGGAAIDDFAAAAINDFNSDDLAANVPAILAIRERLATLPADPLVAYKQRQLDRVLQACLGLTVATETPHADVDGRESLDMRHVVTATAAAPRVKWLAVRYPANEAEETIDAELQPGVERVYEATEPMSAAWAQLSQPYWLRAPAATGIYRVDDADLIGTPEDAPQFPVEHVFEVGGQRLVIADEPIEAGTIARPAAEQRRLEVIAPVTVAFAAEAGVFRPGEAKPVTVDVKAFRPNLTGHVSLEVASGWSVSPEVQGIELTTIGDRQQVTFTVTAPATAAACDITAHATVERADGNAIATYDRSRIELVFPHIPRQLLQPRAVLHAAAFDLAIRGKRVGYVAGAGDSVADGLTQMGYEVTPLAPDDLTAERLRDLDAVVVGIRALNVSEELRERMPALFAFAEAGGNVIVQYNRPDSIRPNQIAPYPLSISGGRVTDETAAMSILAADHPALNAPNKITDADFAGWVQERGLYYADEWGDEFTPLVAAADPGEEPLEGGILVAPHGQGHFVYTSLAWFRQLPAGVPGAYRLFANLVSLGK